MRAPFGLHTNLCEFAAYSGAMVWAPSPGGCAILLDSGDLAAMKQDGTVSQWLAYPPDDTRGWKPRFRTSTDGRLASGHRPRGADDANSSRGRARYRRRRRCPATDERDAATDCSTTPLTSRRPSVAAAEASVTHGGTGVDRGLAGLSWRAHGRTVLAGGGDKRRPGSPCLVGSGHRRVGRDDLGTGQRLPSAATADGVRR